MYKNNRNGKILNILLGVIALFIIIFIIAWVVNKGSNTSKYDAEFKNNLNNIQETAKKYFANDLPKEIGDVNVLTLEDMYELNLTNKLSYGKKACDEEASYISISKINANEYKVKSNLVCGPKADNIVEKISASTIVTDKNDKTIVDDQNKNVTLDVDKNKETKNTTVKCTGPICSFNRIETDCTTTYTYEYVKRNVSCPSGYVLSGNSCVKSTTDTINATISYTDETTKVVDAKVNTGNAYRVYTSPIVKGGTTEKYCSNGTLSSDGYCYDYTSLDYNYTTSCPYGYTKEGSYCYKYANKVDATCSSGYAKYGDLCYKYTDPTTTSTSCPSGYTKSGNECRKEVSGTTTTTCPDGYISFDYKTGTQCLTYVNTTKKYSAWSNPTKSYQTYTQEKTYEYATEKKVLTGKTTIAGKTIYTYSIYNRKVTDTCPQGTLDGDMCKLTATPIKTITCPNGSKKIGNACYETKEIKTTSTCPSGYKLIGNYCYKYYQLDDEKVCPNGYTKSGNKCYIRTSVERDYSYSSCPSGYYRDGNSCYRRFAPSYYTTTETYSCPSGYTKEGYGVNTRCYKTQYTENTYYCENANATLKGTLCYITESKKVSGYTCPNGYDLVGDKCTRTSKVTTTPTWSNSDVVYSKENYLDGYQKTGKARFVTKCTPIQEVHYK